MSYLDREYAVLSTLFFPSVVEKHPAPSSVITKRASATFAVTQTITGTSLEQYNTNPELDVFALKKAIADTMAGVLPSNIKNFLVSAGPTSPTITKSLKKSLITGALITSSIILTYDVTVLFTMTTEQLTTAVCDGTFDGYLHAAASENGASDLEESTSSSIATGSITDVMADLPFALSSVKKNVHGGAIVGAVLCGCGGIVLVALLLSTCTWSCAVGSVGL